MDNEDQKMYETYLERKNLHTGTLYGMGVKGKKIRTLFFLDEDIDPATVPEKLQLWYVQKGDVDDGYMMGRVLAEKPEQGFMGSLITAKMPVPENGILFNFAPYNIMSLVKSIESRKDLSEEKNEKIRLLKLAAKTEGYDENNPDASPIYKEIKDWSRTMEEFTEMV